jgi:hypothetical protein
MLHFLELACHGVHAPQCMQMLKVPFEAEQAGPWLSKLDQQLVAHSAVGDKDGRASGLGHALGISTINMDKCSRSVQVFAIIFA